MMVRVAKQDESVSEIVARVHAEAVAAAEKVPRVNTNNFKFSCLIDGGDGW